MKIKSDFVTNSSSCSFTIMSIASGKIPVIHDNYKEVLPDLFPEMTPVPSQYHIGKDYGYLDITTGCEEDANSINIAVAVKNTTDYDWNGKELINLGAFTCVDISMENQSIHDDAGRALSLSNTVKIIERLLSLNNEKLENGFFTYSAMPIKLTGDGWNGGDPMGPYAYTVDLYLNETKNGLLHIVNNQVFPKVNNIGVDSSILGEVANIINSGEIEYENKK